MRNKFLAIAVLGLLVIGGIGMIFSTVPVHGATSIGNWGGVYNASLSEASIGVSGQVYTYDNLLYIFSPGSHSLTVLNASTYSVIASSTGITGSFGGIFGGSIYTYTEGYSYDANTNYSGIYFTFYEYNYLTLFPGATKTYSFTSVASGEVMSSVSEVYAVYGPYILMPHVAKNPSASYIYNNYAADFAVQGPYFQGISSYNYVTGQWANSTVTTISGVSPVALTSSPAATYPPNFGSDLVSGLTRVTSYGAYSITSYAVYGNTSDPSVEVLLTPVTVTNESTTITSTSSDGSTIGVSFSPLTGASSTVFQSAGTNYIGLNSTYVISQISSPQSVLVSTNTQIMVIQSGHISIEANPVNLVVHSGVRIWNHHLFTYQAPSWHNFSIPMGLSLAASASNQYFSIFQVSIPSADSSYIPASVASTLYFTPDGSFLPAKSIGFTGISGMTFGGPDNMTLYMSGANGELYIATFHFAPVNLEIRSNVQKAASIYIGNLTGNFSSSSPLNISVLPSEYTLNITSPNGFEISNVTILGTGASIISRQGSFEFAESPSIRLNVTGDPVITITFVPNTYNITFSSNLDLGISWLADHGLQKNVSWTVDVLHGTDPSKVIIDSSYLNSTSENDTNYTLIYSASSQNVTFHLFNGTYRFQYFSGNSLFIPSAGKENLTVSGASQTITADFRTNYPVASFYSPPYIPENYAWIFQSNSSAGNGTSLVSQYWKISGPGGLTYQGYGAQFAVFLNVSGNYSANLTVKASNGLENSTVHTFEVVKPRRIPIIISIRERQGYFTNSSATYVISVTTNESIANVIASIDNSSYMKVQFVSSTSDGNGNFTYEYFANFTPSSYPLGNHFLNFSVYTTTAGFNYTHIEARFGSSGSSQPFNLVSFFGGPANFILVILGIIGVVITVAALKIQRSTDVVIEANGRESVIKTKPVKQGILNRKKGGKKK